MGRREGEAYMVFLNFMVFSRALWEITIMFFFVYIAVASVVSSLIVVFSAIVSSFALSFFFKCPFPFFPFPYIAEKLSVKITRLEYLSAFYRKANKLYRKQGNFEGMILTRYWRETLTANALEVGIPVPEKWFWRLRTLLKHYRRRLEAAAKLK